MLRLLLLRIPLCLLPRIYLRSQTKTLNNTNNKPQQGKKKRRKTANHSGNIKQTLYDKEELYYGLKRVGDELSDDPTTGAGEPINQSVRHDLIVHFFPNKSTSRKRNGTKTNKQS